VTADTYIISANGRYGNPDLATLQWIVESAHARKRAVSLVVTNETESTKGLQEKLKPAMYGYTLTALRPGEHSLAITLAD
jgi:hypothetical protein